MGRLTVTDGMRGPSYMVPGSVRWTAAAGWIHRRGRHGQERDRLRPAEVPQLDGGPDPPARGLAYARPGQGAGSHPAQPAVGVDPRLAGDAAAEVRGRTTDPERCVAGQVEQEAVAGARDAAHRPVAVRRRGVGEASASTIHAGSRGQRIRRSASPGSAQCAYHPRDSWPMNERARRRSPRSAGGPPPGPRRRRAGAEGAGAGSNAGNAGIAIRERCAKSTVPSCSGSHSATCSDGGSATTRRRIRAVPLARAAWATSATAFDTRPRYRGQGVWPPVPISGDRGSGPPTLLAGRGLAPCPP